jgi:hypothetical protein
LNHAAREKYKMLEGDNCRKSLFFISGFLLAMGKDVISLNLLKNYSKKYPGRILLTLKGLAIIFTS